MPHIPPVEPKVPPIPEGLDPAERMPYGYPCVAAARGHEPMHYHEFGSYQGEWVLLARDETMYYVYEGGYGSCSGCDSFQSEFDSISGPLTRERVWAFVQDYKTFLEIPTETMKNLVMNDTLAQVLPKNNRDYDDKTFSELIPDWSLIVKAEEGIPFHPEAILQSENQEVRSRAIRAYGVDKMVEDLENAEVLFEKDGERLIRIEAPGENLMYIQVQDPSTDRKYFLRVPPNVTSLEEGRAWTFGMRLSEWTPRAET